MKYYGTIGYATTAEKIVNGVHTSVWEETIVEREYYGDVIKNFKRYEKGEGLNDNINVSNKLSIVADPYALGHFAEMRYATWMDVKWKVADVEIAYPRLNITLGGVYNGPTAGA